MAIRQEKEIIPKGKQNYIFTLLYTENQLKINSKQTN